MQKKLARKQLASDLFYLGLTSTVALLSPVTAWSSWKAEICTHESVMYSCPFPSMLMTVLGEFT